MDKAISRRWKYRADPVEEEEGHNLTFPVPNIPPSWGDLSFFRNEWPPLWRELCAQPHPWQPAPEQIFRALRLTPRPAVRVVIVGQDPYPTPGRATGLAFSFPKDTAPGGSLRNILMELREDMGHPPNTRLSGDLTPWAEQGVLLLNTALTVPISVANGHKNLGWGALVHQVLQAVAADRPQAFILWGGAAQKLRASVPRAEAHLWICNTHPSPLSVNQRRSDFWGSRPFTRVNDWLGTQGQQPIDWITPLLTLAE